MKTNILNNNFGSNSTLNRILELNQSKEEFSKSVDGATAPKYKDLAEIQDSGNSVIYNQAKHDLVMRDVYKTVNTSVNVRLDSEELAMDKIRDIIAEFKEDLLTITENFPGIMTKTQLCDKALIAIGSVLNTQSSDGKYLFGGVSASDKPCVDLTTFSNLDSAGNILNNYTNATPNLKTIAIGDGANVQIGLDASNKAFATLIGAINRLKNSPNAVPTDAEDVVLQNELNSAIMGFEGIEATILNNRRDVESAEHNSDAKYLEAVEILSSAQFVISTDELVQKLFEYAKSLKILESIKILDNKMSERLLNILPTAA